MAERTNETWLRHLHADGPEQQAALRDLRDVLLRRLRKAMAGYARADDAFLEDAVQDSLLLVLDRLTQFAHRSHFLTWTTSIAIRTAMSELRRRRWKDLSLEDVLADPADVRGPEASADEPALYSQQRALVDTMYDVIRQQLTPRQRTALLAELRGMPQIEIARHLESNRNAVYKLIHDARKRLRRGLEAAGFQGGDVHAAFS